MKRPLLFFFLVMMLAWFVTARYLRVHNAPHYGPLDERLRATNRAHRDALKVVREARDQAHQAAREAHVELHRALVDTREGFRESLDEASEELQEAAEEIRTAVDGLPATIPSGTRDLRALPQAPALAELPPVEAPAYPPGPPAQWNSPGFPGLADHPRVSSPPLKSIIMPRKQLAAPLGAKKHG